MSNDESTITKKEENIQEKLDTRPTWYIPYLVATMSIISLLDNNLSLLETSVIAYMAEDFGLELGYTQIWIGIFGLISFGVILINWVTDAFGRKKGLILLTLILGIPSILLPIVTPSGPAGLIPSMILYSLLTLATQANTWEIPVAEEVPPKKRGLLGATPFLIGLFPIYALAGEPIAESLGWKWAYAILGGILFIAGLAMVLFMKETHRWIESRDEIKEARQNIWKTLKTLSRKDWSYIALGGVAYFVWGTAFKIGTLGGQETFIAKGIGDQFSTFLTIGGLLTIFGALTSGIIMDKVSRKAALIVGCVGSISAFVLFGVTGIPIFFTLIFFCMPMILAYITVYFLAEIFPTKIRATCAGAVITVSRASYIVGPLLSGGLILAFNVGDNPTMWWGYWVVGGLLLLIPLLMQVFIEHYETRHKTLEEIEQSR